MGGIEDGGRREAGYPGTQLQALCPPRGDGIAAGGPNCCAAHHPRAQQQPVRPPACSGPSLPELNKHPRGSPAIQPGLGLAPGPRGPSAACPIFGARHLLWGRLPGPTAWTKHCRRLKLHGVPASLSLSDLPGALHAEKQRPACLTVSNLSPVHFCPSHQKAKTASQRDVKASHRQWTTPTRPPSSPARRPTSSWARRSLP